MHFNDIIHFEIVYTWSIRRWTRTVSSRKRSVQLIVDYKSITCDWTIMIGSLASWINWNHKWCMKITHNYRIGAVLAQLLSWSNEDADDRVPIKLSSWAAIQNSLIWNHYRFYTLFVIMKPIVFELNRNFTFKFERFHFGLLHQQPKMVLCNRTFSSHLNDNCDTVSVFFRKSVFLLWKMLNSFVNCINNEISLEQARFVNELSECKDKRAQ